VKYSILGEIFNVVGNIQFGVKYSILGEIFNFG